MTYTTTCARDECTRPTSGKSKYCSTHKVEARAAFKAMVADQAAARAERDELFARQHAAAHAIGMAAGEEALTTPMVVVQHANPLNDDSEIVKVYEPVMDGPCGFAYVYFRPGNHPFVNWLKRQGIGFKRYYGGWEFSVRAFGQSMQRKEAYARAYANALRSAGIEGLTVGYTSRMD